MRSALSDDSVDYNVRYYKVLNTMLVCYCPDRPGAGVGEGWKIIQRDRINKDNPCT